MGWKKGSEGGFSLPNLGLKSFRRVYFCYGILPMSGAGRGLPTIRSAIAAVGTHVVSVLLCLAFVFPSVTPILFGVALILPGLRLVRSGVTRGCGLAGSNYRSQRQKHSTQNSSS